MQHRHTSYSFYALTIALLVHLVVILLLTFIEKITPILPPTPKEEKPQENRFKVSLKEQPKILNEALIKNEIPKHTKSRPLPKGEQLKTQPAPSKPISSSVPNVPKKRQEVTRQEPTPPEPKKAYETHVAKNVATIERKPQPKKEFNLYDSLSQSQEATPVSSSSSAKISNNIQKLYGDKFAELSEGEQKYILDNQEVMRRITQSVLNRYGQSRLPDNLHVEETNIIEFYLHPDGSISDIRYLKNSRYAILDDITKETIEIAYGKYPRPAQKTYIRYPFRYNLTGY